MIFQNMLLIIGSIIGIVLGFYILFAGRHALWATLGIIALTAATNLMATLLTDGSTGLQLIKMQRWDLLGAAILIGILGMAVGKYKEDWAAYSIGFIAGADATLWFYDVTTHLIINVDKQLETAAYVTGLLLILVGGLLGLWLVHKIRDEALILITMLVGAELILDGFGFSSTSSWTAIIMISLALAGILVQYAIYLREIKSELPHPQVHPSSLAYFQDLELDL